MFSGMFSGRDGDLERASFGSVFPARQAVAVLVTALLFRLLFWLLAADSPFLHTPVVDGSFFDLWARALAAGKPFQDQAFFKPPLYPYLLSGLYRLGFGMTGVIGLQLMVGAVTCVLTLGVARVLLTARRAFCAAMVQALLPILPFFELQLLAESWTLMLTMGSLLLLLLVVTGRIGPSLRNLGAAGLLLGVAALGRPNLLLGWVVFSGGLWWLGRHRMRGIGKAYLPFSLGFFLAISPATLHNIRYGDFALISNNLGINLYTGQSDLADGVSAIPVGVVWDDMQLQARQAGAESPGAASRFYTRQALAWMAAHPGRTFGLWLKKTVLLFSGYEGRNNINPLWFAREDGVFLLARWWPATWLLLPFAVVGLVWAGRGEPGWWLLRWFVLTQAAAVVPFFVAARFRAPLLPMLAAFGVAGLVYLASSLREKNPIPWAVFLAAVILVNGDWYGLGQPRWLARDHFNLATLLVRPYDGRIPDPAAADAHYRKSLELDPDDVDANERYGAFLLEAARPRIVKVKKDAASGEWEEEALGDLDHMLMIAGTHHRRAATLYPRSFRSWSNLGVCLMWRGDLKALRSRSYLAVSDSAGARSSAEDALRFYGEAQQVWRKSLEVNPGQEGIRRQLPNLSQAVLDLPPVSPAIRQIQDQLRRP